jgi:glycosyltransferase involved in cell wall biosynthesis
VDNVTGSAPVASDQPGVVENSISAIMPVYNGAAYIGASLPPLAAMLERGEIVELIVVNDGSTDNSVEIAEKVGATVHHTGGRMGVGHARNIAAKVARGDILWYVDADVIAHDEVALKLREAFTDAQITAVIGSYDDQPPAQNFLSQYKNLLNHHFHHRGSTEASTFWGGCGAVRKREFLAINGFDTERYRLPSIEDIELGYRLRDAGGRILLLADVQGTHLKEWRFVDFIRTEIFRRAIPWATLMLERGDITDDLNVSTGERLKAALAGVLALSVIGAMLGLVSWWLPGALLVAAGAANFGILRLFNRRKGPLFALCGLLTLQTYYLYSGASFVFAFIRFHLFSNR